MHPMKTQISLHIRHGVTLDVVVRLQIKIFLITYKTSVDTDQSEHPYSLFKFCLFADRLFKAHALATSVDHEQTVHMIRMNYVYVSLTCHKVIFYFESLVNRRIEKALIRLLRRSIC